MGHWGQTTLRTQRSGHDFEDRRLWGQTTLRTGDFEDMRLWGQTYQNWQKYWIYDANTWGMNVFIGYMLPTFGKYMSVGGFSVRPSGAGLWKFLKVFCRQSCTVLKVACPQSRLSSKSPVLKVVCPQSRVLKVVCPQCPIVFRLCGPQNLLQNFPRTIEEWGSPSLPSGTNSLLKFLSERSADFKHGPHGGLRTQRRHFGTQWTLHWGIEGEADLEMECLTPQK